MESIFCPSAAEHRSLWSAQGSGLKPKCPSCVSIQLYAPGKTPLVCYWCQGAVDVAMLPVCKSCGVATTKGKRKTNEVREMQNLLNEHRNEILSHIDSGIKTAGQPSADDLRASIEQQLRRTEMLLDESRLEVDRLTQDNLRLKELSQSGGGSTAGLDTILAKLEEISQKSEETAHASGLLTEENKTLRHELESLRKQPRTSLSSQSHSEAIPSFAGSESITAIAELTARKVVDVMPLLGDIHVSDSWLKLKSLESFLGLADLAVLSQEKAVQMRKVSRVGVQIAKLVGPCKAVTSFGVALKSRLEEDSEKCMKLVRDLKRIYIRVSKDTGSAELMRELLQKLASGSPAFDSTVAVIAYLSEVLTPPQLKAMSTVLFDFLEQPHDTSEWVTALTGIPLQWQSEHKEKAVAGIRKLMAAVVKMNFDPACLQLLQILNNYKHPDPEPLMIFVSRASDALQGDMPVEHVQDLIRKLFDFLKMDVPPEKSSLLSEKAFSALRVYFHGADVTKEQVALIMCMLLSLQADTFDSLVWLYGDTKSEGNVQSALKLLKEMEVHKNPLEHNAQVTVKFFHTLATASVLTPQEALTFIKATSQLCDMKNTKTEEIVVTLTSMLSNPVSHQFAKELAILSDINEPKDMIWETNKLLNTARRNPTEAVLPTARYLASMICQLRNFGITTIVLNHALKMVLINKTNHLKQLLAALRPIMKGEEIAANLAVKLIDLLPKQPDELVHLLSFVADLGNYLSSQPMTTGEMAINFCADAILPCFFTDNTTFLIMMHAQLQANRLNFLSEMLRKAQRRLTTLDVYELCILPNLQPTILRLFDCARQEAKVINLEQTIKVTTSSSYAFIDDGNLISCGGNGHSGFESASGAISVTST